MAIDGIYDTGTISVNAGATAVTGVGTAWTTVGITAGDTFEAGGLIGLVESVTDNTHLTLTRAWPGAANLSGVGYQIVENSWLRSDISTSQRQIGRIVNILNGTGYIYPVAAGGTPDNSLGEDNQYALDFTNLLIWKKSGGVWSNATKIINREKLTANRTFYVRTDGNDANDGLSNSAGGAFASVTGGYQKLRDSFELNGKTVTFSVQSGTYGAQVISGLCPGQVSSSQIVIDANSTSTIFDGNTAGPIDPTFTIAQGARVTLYRGKYKNSGAGRGIAVYTGSVAEIKVQEFGACATEHIFLSTSSQGLLYTNYTISGGASFHLRLFLGARLETSDITVTLTGTPAFSGGFIYADLGSVAYNTAVTFSGSATGPRYVVTNNSSIATYGGGANYFPGNVAGYADAATYGSYT